MHDMIFRCGWDSNIQHKIFSYVFTSMSNGMRCGNTQAHWFYKVPSEIYCGFPPTFDDIQTQYNMVQVFVNSLFIHNTGLHYKKKLNNILSVYVLIFYDEFLGIIGNEPSGKHKDPSNYPFHEKTFSIIFELRFMMQIMINGRRK